MNGTRWSSAYRIDGKTEYCRLHKIDGVKALFDLSNGSLENEPIGRYDGIVEIYSAEAFLCEVETMKNATITAIWVPSDRIWWKE